MHYLYVMCAKLIVIVLMYFGEYIASKRHCTGSYGYKYLKIVRRKHPNCLADSCKCLSVNRMAAGLRLPRSSHGFFFFHLLFKHTLCSQLKGFRPQDLLVYRLCLKPVTSIIFNYQWIISFNRAVKFIV